MREAEFEMRGQDSHSLGLAAVQFKSFRFVMRGQDSNLRTDKDCDLNAAPLTKLGDPRG